MKEKRSRRGNERGVALLLAIFALLLISAIAAALLFSSDTETLISANYRDKQIAIYAALSGLQEGRDRIHPTHGDLGPNGPGGLGTGLNLVPTGLPDPAAQNVLYIVNPDPGESVRPWDPANKYYDSELCHENTALCSEGALSTATWYKVYDNSQHATNWQLKNASGTKVPLRYKWVRITLKADNMTPVPVGTGTGKQVCWSASHEIQKPVSYHSDCTPPGDGVTNIAITNQGSGYTTVPTVTITGGGGSGATATAEIGPLPSGVTSVTLTDGGAGYPSAPNVQIVPVDGNGGGAIVTTITTGALPVGSVTVNNGTAPACWPSSATASGFTVSFNPNSTGVSGKVTATIPNSCIYDLAGSGRCDDATSPVTGTGFSGTVNWATKKVTFDNPGSYGANGVPAASTFTVTCTNNPGNGANKPKISSVTGGVQISTASGSGGAYTSPPAVSFTGYAPVGNGSTTGIGNLTGTVVPGAVASLNLAAGGSGYTSNPDLRIDPPPAGAGNRQATGQASISPTDGVIAITIDNAGSGYTSKPTVTLTEPGGSGTTATATASIGSGGTFAGAVYLITSFAETVSGARAMAQMEVGVTYQKFSFNLGGALTLAGPSPTFGTPNSNNFLVDGRDANSCNDPNGKFPARPAIGVFDDPNNPTTPTAVKKVIDALGKEDNYIGAHDAPDIENVFGSLGDSATPDGLNAFVQAVAAVATNKYGSDPGSIALGTAKNPVIDFVDGDYTMGPTTGYGILLVTGQLTFKGNYSWKGLVLAIGTGASVMDGGGNGQIDGAVFVSNTKGSSTYLSSPSATVKGGGTNTIKYDHCWADNMLAKVPFTPTASPSALKVISTRMLDF